MLPFRKIPKIDTTYYKLTEKGMGFMESLSNYMLDEIKFNGYDRHKGKIRFLYKNKKNKSKFKRKNILDYIYSI